MAHQKIQVRGYTANLFSCPIFALFFCTCSHTRRTSTKKSKADPTDRGVGLTAIIVSVATRLVQTDLALVPSQCDIFCALVVNTAYSIDTGHIPRHRYSAGHRQTQRLTEYTGSDPDRRAHPANDLPHRPCLPLSAHRAFLARQTICRPEFFP